MMQIGLDVEVFTDSQTVMGNLLFYFPSAEDSRISPLDHKFITSKPIATEPQEISGHFKIKDEADMNIIVANLISVLNNAGDNVKKGSLIARHICYNHETPTKPCLREIIWSK